MTAETDEDDLIQVGASDVVKEATHWLELFDDAFANDDIPFQQRPLKAAMWLVKDGIAQVVGGSKDNFWEQPWFSEIVVGIRAWYQDRYGPDAFEPENDTLRGLVILRGTPVRLTIRTTLSKVEVENETAWLIFADSVHESEDVLSFFVSRPNLNAIAPDDRARLEASVTSIVTQSRRINLALQSASGLSPDAKRLQEGVWGHIDKAVADILTLKPAIAAIGAWELHLAVEKAFKVFLYQNGHDASSLKSLGHDMVKLDGAAKTAGLTVSADALAKLPHWKVASSNRYAQTNIAVTEVVAIYEVALQLMEEITGKLKRRYVVNNAALLLKKPAWVGSR